MLNKRDARLRRARRSRMKMRELKVPRLSVHRTPQHIYSQIIVPTAGGDKVLAAASSLDKAVKSEGYTGNVAAATKVGRLLAERAVAAGLKAIAFDRSGFQYHGRIRALAEAAREGGLEF